MPIYTKEEQFELIYNSGWEELKNIDNQYEDVCLEAVKINGEALYYVKRQTPEICLEAVKQNGDVLDCIKNQTKEICIEAVKNSEWALSYVDEQTEEICLEAVKSNGWALQYVRNQTEKICIEAVKESGGALKYVEYQTEEICLEAVKSYGRAFEYVKEQTPEICFYAYLNDNRLKLNKSIKAKVDSYIQENHLLTNKVFCVGFWDSFSYEELRKKYKSDYEFINLDINSLLELQALLVNSNYNNHFIVYSYLSLSDEVIKKIALSNSKLIVIKEDYREMKPIYNILANKIVPEDELFKESF